MAALSVLWHILCGFDTDIIFQMGKLELNSSPHVYTSHVSMFTFDICLSFFIDSYV